MFGLIEALCKFFQLWHSSAVVSKQDVEGSNTHQQPPWIPLIDNENNNIKLEYRLYQFSQEVSNIPETTLTELKDGVTHNSTNVV